MWHSLIFQHSLISEIVTFLYPSKCPVCTGNSDTFLLSPICSSCWTDLKEYAGPSCNVCAFPITSEYSRICGQCLKKSPPFSRVINYGLYEGVLAEAINQLKFHRIKRLAKPLGSLLQSIISQKPDGIIPVPLGIKALRERGFNQSLLIARVIAKNIKVPLMMNVLLKMKDTPPQVGLSAKERLFNVKNAFEVRGNVKGLKLFLVDDVMTTGATVTECSKELMKAGAEEITVLTLARSKMM